MSKLLSIFSSYAFLEAIIIGIIGAVFLKILSIFYKNISNYIYSHNNFSIAGTWVADFDSIGTKKNIEIMHIKEKKEMVVLHIEQYSNNINTIKKLKGKGIFRGNTLSLFYYTKNKNDIDNGTMILETKHCINDGTLLVGVFAEVLTEDSLKSIKKMKYEMKRFKISFAKKIRHFFKGYYFKDYDDLKKYLKK